MDGSFFAPSPASACALIPYRPCSPALFLGFRQGASSADGGLLEELVHAYVLPPLRVPAPAERVHVVDVDLRRAGVLHSRLRVLVEQHLHAPGSAQAGSAGQCDSVIEQKDFSSELLQWSLRIFAPNADPPSHHGHVLMESNCQADYDLKLAGWKFNTKAVRTRVQEY